jgi:virginiamycin B lyase
LAPLLMLPAASHAQWLRTTTYNTGLFSNPSGIVAGPDGALWFTQGCNGIAQFETCGESIERITTSGATTLYSLPYTGVTQAPTGITNGSDGALWFTESLGNKIGRITTTGVINEYPIPTANSYALSIAAGPDGALWFTEAYGNKIGRATVSGSIAEYTIPTAGSYPSSIAAGSDGALWFTEGGSSKIGRITTTGFFTEYAVPNAPSSITAGPDGALWFLQNTGLGRLTTTGSFTAYPVPIPSGVISSEALYALTTGPDGALWFTLVDPFDSITPMLGRMTTSGQVTEFPSPVALGSPQDDSPTGIAIGPDGNLWYTDDSGTILKAPACGVGLTVTYAPTAPNTGTLTIGFDLGIYIPNSGQGTWSFWLITSQVKKLYSQSGPTVAPPEKITIPVPNFPAVGNVGVLSTLTTNAGGLQCYDLQFTNTNGTGMSIQELKEKVRSSGLVPLAP